jgi:ParB-like chromosome segregation protein Spo0J
MDELEKDLEQIAREIKLIREFLLRLVIFGKGVPEPVSAAMQRIMQSITHAQNVSRRNREQRLTREGDPTALGDKRSSRSTRGAVQRV